jgi:hypothetical protein
MAAALITEVSAMAVPRFVLGAGVGESASALPGADRTVPAWAAGARRNMPNTPSSVDDRNMRLPINGCSTDMVVLPDLNRYFSDRKSFDGFQKGA